MELETAFKMLVDHGWKTILSAASLVLIWHLVRSGGGRDRPLLALAIGQVYSDMARGVSVWWKYHRETLEAQRDRDREIALAYATTRPDGRRSGDRLLPDAGAEEGRNRDTRDDRTTIEKDVEHRRDWRFTSDAPDSDDPCPVPRDDPHG